MTVCGLATIRPFPQNWMGQTGEIGVPGWVDILVVSPALLLAFFYEATDGARLYRRKRPVNDIEQ